MHEGAWYHLYPLGFLGAERHNDGTGPVVHRLAGLVPWLDHIAGLGARTLLLGPVFESRTHGYDTTDHARIDRRLGDDEDFDALVEACRARDLALVLDGVFNHVGRDFGPFADVRAHGRDSAFASWFDLDFGGTGPDGFAYRCFEGHEELPVLRHDEPEVRAHVIEAACTWLDRGASGWRLDAAYAMPRDFVRELVDAVRRRHPGAVFLAEVIHGDYAGFVRSTAVDTVTQYELWKALWSSLVDRNFFELTYALERHAALLDTFTPATFLGNHDVTRIASQVPPGLLAHAYVLLLALPGIPCLYAGDEAGLTGVKRHERGGDDVIRPAFPAAPADLAGPRPELADLVRGLLAARARLGPQASLRTAVEHRTNAQLVGRTDGRNGSLWFVLNVADHAVDLAGRLPSHAEPVLGPGSGPPGAPESWWVGLVGGSPA